ncbi:TonB-dependent receptor plug domain-containing protein, partial [Neisseria wadsworthii]
MIKTHLLPIAAMVGIAFNMPAYADTVEATDNQAEATEVETVTVKGKRQGQVTTERKTREDIDNEMIRDTRDLVRYSTDVGISDNGRHLKGFAMRGVEGNRVGVSVDGVSLPDSEENTLYARYGNFNSSRLSIDPELVRTIDIVKGADSFEAGSGALGGNVNYRTLEVRDIVDPEQKFGALLRTGYATKNREWTHTAGAGFVGDSIDAIVLYSHRYGHQLKSRGEGNIYRGSESQHPDPAEHKNHSFLTKFAYQITPEHRL